MNRIEGTMKSWAWGHVTGIPELGRLRQEGHNLTLDLHSELQARTIYNETLLHNEQASKRIYIRKIRIE